LSEKLNIHKYDALTNLLNFICNSISNKNNDFLANLYGISSKIYKKLICSAFLIKKISMLFTFFFHIFVII